MLFGKRMTPMIRVLRPERPANPPLEQNVTKKQDMGKTRNVHLLLHKS